MLLETLADYFEVATGPDGKEMLVIKANVCIGPVLGTGHTLFFGGSNPGLPRITADANCLKALQGLTLTVIEEKPLPVFYTNTTAKKALGKGKPFVTPKGYNRTTY